MSMVRIGRWWSLPTMRGEIRWRNESWGTVVTEYVQGESAYSIRVPWNIVKAIQASKDQP